MDKRFENITMTGRMCYIFMCMERYLLALYPDRDWTFVAKKMWQWPAASCWHDDEWDAYISIMPELVMTGYKTEGYETAQDYIDAGFHEITREEYEQAVALYTGLTDGNPEDEICRLFDIPCTMVNVCDGYDYNDEVGDKQTVDAINEIEGILKKRGIPLPDISLVAEYSPENVDYTIKWWYKYGPDFFPHNDRWGMPTRGTEKLSIILNKEKNCYE